MSLELYICYQTTDACLHSKPSVSQIAQIAHHPSATFQELYYQDPGEVLTGMMNKSECASRSKAQENINVAMRGDLEDLNQNTTPENPLNLKGLLEGQKSAENMTPEEKGIVVASLGDMYGLNGYGDLVNKTNQEGVINALIDRMMANNKLMNENLALYNELNGPFSPEELMLLANRAKEIMKTFCNHEKTMLEKLACVNKKMEKDDAELEEKIRKMKAENAQTRAENEKKDKTIQDHCNNP